MSSLTIKPTLAVLGASGDCAGWALASALNNGHSCRALARNPDKLLSLMAAKGVSQDILAKSLFIIKGNAKDKDDVKNLLRVAADKTVDRVLFGIGGKPTFIFSPRLFTLDDPSVCEAGMAALLAALSELAQDPAITSKPQVTALSTTGITSGPRDVPILFLPLYHWFLHTPHVDKRIMEQLLRSSANRASTVSTGLSAATIIRPSLLTGGEGKGLSSIRAGTEARPAVGYTIARKDVGVWIYENLLTGKDTKWIGETITVT